MDFDFDGKPDSESQKKDQRNREIEYAFLTIKNLSEKKILNQEMVSQKKKIVMIMWNKRLLREKLSKFKNPNFNRGLVTVCSIFLEDNFAEIVKQNLEHEVVTHFQSIHKMKFLTHEQYSSVITSFYKMSKKYTDNNPL